jgi:hypothetical protein
MRTDGLAWRRWIEPIDAFVRDHGRLTPRWAVFCTYDFEPERVETDILPCLQRRGRQFRTLLLADAGRVQERLSLGLAPSGRLNIHPVRLVKGGVFHPKLVFLRAGHHVRVCVGSSNLTSGGLGANLELWAHSDDPEVCRAAAFFLTQLSDHEGVVLDPPAERALARALMGIERRPSRRLWTSLGGSFPTHLRGPDSGLASARAVHIVSPAYVSRGGIGAVLEPFRSRGVTVYTDGPLSHAEARFKYFEPPVAADDEDDNDAAAPERRTPAALHTKAYLFEGRRESTLWFGSANWTVQALLRTPNAGGNVEVLLKTRLGADEATVLLGELSGLFGASKAPSVSRTAEPEPQAANRGAILSGELRWFSGGPCLLLHVLPHTKSVKVEIDGKPICLRVSRQRAVLPIKSGRILTRLAEGRNGEDWAGLIFEIVGADRIPVIVNVPMVREPEDGAADLETAAEDLIDEFLRCPQSRSGGMLCSR